MSIARGISFLSSVESANTTFPCIVAPNYSKWVAGVLINIYFDIFIRNGQNISAEFRYYMFFYLSMDASHSVCFNVG